MEFELYLDTSNIFFENNLHIILLFSNNKVHPFQRYYAIIQEFDLLEKIFHYHCTLSGVHAIFFKKKREKKKKRVQMLYLTLFIR